MPTPHTASVTTQAIEAADDARIRALVETDLAALDDALAEELVYVHGTAFVDDKKSYLRGLGAGHVRFLDITREDTRVRLVEGVALLDCAAHTRVEIHGKARDVKSRVMSAWVQRDGRWQMVHYHATNLPTAAT